MIYSETLTNCASMSFKAGHQVFCKTSLLTRPVRPFPPTQIYEWKGPIMKGPLDGGLSVRNFDPLLENSQGHADDLGVLDSKVLTQPINQQLVLFSETQSGLDGRVLQGSPSDLTANECPQATQQAPENSLSGTGETVSKAYPEGDVASIAPSCPPPIPQLDWLLDPKKQRPNRVEELGTGSLDSTYDRILSRLALIEAKEEDAHLKTDCRIAWFTVRFCQTGEAVECTPAVLASYKVLGCHPDHVWPRITQRRNWVLGAPKSIQLGRVKSNLASHTDTLTKASQAGAVPPSSRCQTAPVPFPEKRRA